MLDFKSFASSSEGNLYTVSDSKTKLMLECGLPWKEIQCRLDFKTSEIAGCLLSHEHKDHAKAVGNMLRAGIDCYMSQGTADAIFIGGHRAHIIKPLNQFQIDTWRILPFSTIHNVAEPLGFLLASGKEKLLFATDTAYLKFRFKGLTHIMIECNYSLPLLKANTPSSELRQLVIRNHMSLSTLCDFMRANDLSKVEEIHLLHLSDTNSDADSFKKRIQEITGKPVRIAGV